jgi:hypothetical protein
MVIVRTDRDEIEVSAKSRIIFSKINIKVEKKRQKINTKIFDTKNSYSNVCFSQS